MDYYHLLSSYKDVLGEEGFWRLPNYLPDEYVMDPNREQGLGKAISIAVKGGNILISGSAGTGKTAFMFMVLKKLLETGYNVGLIREGVGYIGNDHLQEGIILFYDDLPRMNEGALKSLRGNNVRGLVATARSEELPQVRKILGDYLDSFEIIDLSLMTKENLKKILMRFSSREGVKIVDKDSVEIVCNKAQGLPVYIWQVVRELRIKGGDLTTDFASKIPQGMFDYVDDILWRVLDEHDERYEVLLTLLIMSDMPRFALHQDLYNSVFIVSKERRVGKKLGIEEALFSDLLDRITRYLSRESKTYSFRLPHDSWGDVLKGKSKGPMSGEISRINTAYPKSKRFEILKSAIVRAWNEVIKSSEDEARKKAFMENLLTVMPKIELEELLKREAVKVEETKVVGIRTEMAQTERIGAENINKFVENPLLIDGETQKKLIEIASSKVENVGKRILAVQALIEYWKETRDEKIVPIIKSLLKDIGGEIALHKLGSFNYVLGHLIEAKEAFKRSWQLNNEKSLLGLALVDLRLGKVENAIKNIENYLKKNPDDKEARALLRSLKPTREKIAPITESEDYGG